MNRSFGTSVGLIVPLFQHGTVLADLLPPDDRVPSESQSRMVTVACGLLVCAFIAVVIVRVRKNRQQAAQSKKESPSGKT